MCVSVVDRSHFFRVIETLKMPAFCYFLNLTPVFLWLPPALDPLEPVGGLQGVGLAVATLVLLLGTVSSVSQPFAGGQS